MHNVWLTDKGRRLGVLYNAGRTYTYFFSFSSAIVNISGKHFIEYL